MHLGCRDVAARMALKTTWSWDCKKVCSGSSEDCSGGCGKDYSVGCFKDCSDCCSRSSTWGSSEEFSFG